MENSFSFLENAWIVFETLQKCVNKFLGKNAWKPRKMRDNWQQFENMDAFFFAEYTPNFKELTLLF